MPVVIGTHPIPEKYRAVHEKLSSWMTLEVADAVKAPELVQLSYDREEGIVSTRPREDGDDVGAPGGAAAGP